LESKKHSRWKRNRENGGSAGGRREPGLTFLLLSSHFLFFSGAEEGEDTAIASLASIGTAQPKLQSIPEGRTPVTPHKRGEERGRWRRRLEGRMGYRCEDARGERRLYIRGPILAPKSIAPPRIS
jgi:hypothetical protein